VRQYGKTLHGEERGLGQGIIQEITFVNLGLLFCVVQDKLLNRNSGMAPDMVATALIGSYETSI
jgi:hypothetical protein